MEVGELLVYVLLPLVVVVFLAGVRWGRGFSSIVLVICLIGFGLVLFVPRTAAEVDILLGHTEGTTLRAYVGSVSLFGGFASLGPAAFRQWPLAFTLSVVALALFIFSGLPLFFVCGWFGSCP